MFLLAGFNNLLSVKIYIWYILFSMCVCAFTHTLFFLLKQVIFPIVAKLPCWNNCCWLFGFENDLLIWRSSRKMASDNYGPLSPSALKNGCLNGRSNGCCLDYYLDNFASALQILFWAISYSLDVSGEHKKLAYGHKGWNLFSHLKLNLYPAKTKVKSGKKAFSPLFSVTT